MLFWLESLSRKYRIPQLFYSRCCVITLFCFLCFFLWGKLIQLKCTLLHRKNPSSFDYFSTCTIHRNFPHLSATRFGNNNSAPKCHCHAQKSGWVAACWGSSPWTERSEEAAEIRTCCRQAMGSHSCDQLSSRATKSIRTAGSQQGDRDIKACSWCPWAVRDTGTAYSNNCLFLR